MGKVIGSISEPAERPNRYPCRNYPACPHRVRSRNALCPDCKKIEEVKIKLDGKDKLCL
jgi:hypothetical protein